MPKLAAERTMLTAAANGDAPAVRKALAQGADVNARNRHGETALFCASWNGHTDIVTCLLDHHADLALTDVRQGATPLHKAIICPFTVYEQLIDAGAPVNAQDSMRQTPMMYALSKPERVARLLAAGADPNHQAGQQGPTPLTAVLQPLGSGALLDEAAFLALQKPYEKTLQHLLGAGANPNQVDGAGCTPLGQALTFRWGLPCIAMLVEAGADLGRMIPRQGKAAKDLLESRPEVVAWLERRTLEAFMVQEQIQPVAPARPRRL